MPTRSLLLSLVLLIAGCMNKTAIVSKSPSKSPAAGSEWTPTGNDDVDVTVVALTDFMRIPRITTLADGQHSSLVVNQKTNPPGQYISDTQIQTEMKRAIIPAGVIASMQTRNTASTDVTWIPPGLAFFVSDLDSLPQDLTELQAKFPEVYPKAMAGVWLWMPGYSEDGQWAMVRFSFAPTAHGATATFILAKDDTGKWQVVNRGVNYFM